MKLNKLFIEKDVSETLGIAEINIERLGSVVAFVGKNGSGKSRILELLEKEFINNITYKQFVDGSFTQIPITLQKQIESIKPLNELLIIRSNLQKSQQLVKKFPNNKDLLKKYKELSQEFNNISKSNNLQLKRLSSSIKNFDTSLLQIPKRYYTKIDYQEIRQLQQVMQKNENDNSLTFENLIEEMPDTKEYNEFKLIHKSALNFLVKLPHKLVYDKDDCYGDPNKYEKRISHKRFLSLQKLFKDFLNKELTWDKKNAKSTLTESGVESKHIGIWKLDGRELKYDEFSEGEKTLFFFALLFFLLEQNPNLRIKESIVVFDEPELHLHPDSELDLINGIRKAIGSKGQLWIATHSINILSDLNYDEIFMVKDGVIKHPSQSTPSESLSQLMSIEERVFKLSEFLTSISDWDYVNFMTQCFSKPDVITSARKNDPQVELFKKALKSNKGKMNMLLDFGAGKGRLYERVKNEEYFISHFNYSALEPEKKYHQSLNDLGVRKIFSGYQELPDNTFDNVVLCNVLHEIQLSEWIETLNKIINSLKDVGFLIIIEDRILPKGEKIGEIGYLVIDLQEIKELFGLKKQTSAITMNHKHARIMFAIIQKENIKKVTGNSLLKTMQSLEKNTLIQIKKLKAQGKKNDSPIGGIGRRLAFYSQQYINAILAQENINLQFNKE